MDFKMKICLAVFIVIINWPISNILSTFSFALSVMYILYRLYTSFKFH